ncbi:HAMP domain-containing sensor histidine kinase [Stigmatella sp. ncwal1]|uniref:histidine kinase n=1 Tax=Stigmatella ashevillensis TaxID=2995309 RepID=A0ABT5D3U8_9BACT|nr:HAMP domain-containing sensor histidine kinase [Stigmatella ashevillena]MDC0708246.1 HAMP domain-containing sensor histidine kinase [Stigmatella ashevillena]
MVRRLLPTLIALGFGLLALGWGLVSLQIIFTQEREDAYTQLRSRRDTLEQYATETLRQALSRRLDENIPALYRAMEDPLAPADGLYLLFRSYQFLPRLPRPPPGPQTPARGFYEDFRQRLESPGRPGPAQERLEMLRAIEAALARGEEAHAEQFLEALLRHRAEHPLPPHQELPFTLLLAERLQRGRATPSLVRGLVRGGLADDFGGIARGAGLQRDLLRECQRFTQADFDFLRERILQLSAGMGEPAKAFRARIQELGTGALVLPNGLEEPTLIGERWYVHPNGEAVRGIAVSLEEELKAIAQDMRSRELFGAEDGLRLGKTDAVQPLSTLRVEAVMPRWLSAEADIARRYGLKTMLVASCGALAVAIGVIAVLAQRRKYRFLELQSDFVATVSHELRTPLASIRLLAETLERRVGGTSEGKDYPARIIQTTDTLHFLVENILSFNRIDKGRWAPRFSTVRLEELAGTLRTDLLDASQVPVNFTSDVAELELVADPALLRLLLSNLGRNACAYNRRNPVDITLRAHHSPTYGHTLLFSDNGIGIPESEWENVFHDFYRLKSPGPEVHGSGLGLALCRRIMRLHGGRIHVATSGPEGTTFALTFPEPRR